MPINISGTWRDTKAWWVNVSGTWREGTGVFTKVAGVWRQEAFSAALSATLSPSIVSGFSLDPGPAISNPCTVTPVGGVPPYDFLWQKVGGDTVTVTSPTSSVTTFSGFGLLSGTYRCRVVDDEETIVFTGNVTVDLEVEE